LLGKAYTYLRGMFFLTLLCVVGSIPTFPPDWSANQENFLVVKQGDFVITPDGAYCCGEGSNCQVQTAYEKGVEYFSYSTNQTRFDDHVANEVIITDYIIGKEMLVASSTNLTCVEYCPTQFPLDPYSIDSKAKDKGPVKIHDKEYEDWFWEEKILLFIVMEKIDVFVDQSDTKNPVPFIERDELTPFGEDIGTANSTFTNFKPGKQDPALFAVQGAAHCRQSPNCGELSRQMKRIRNHDWASFHYYRHTKKPMKSEE